MHTPLARIALLGLLPCLCAWNDRSNDSVNPTIFEVLIAVVVVSAIVAWLIWPRPPRH